VAVSWASARTRFALRNPADVLCPELLCAVFAALPLRDRLACAAVCRAWRRELAPAATARNAHAWARVDLSHAAFPLARTLDADALRALLVDDVLPRFGAHVRELSLRGTAADDETLALVLAACPNLRLLDVRGCRGALTWSHGDGPQYGFMDLLLSQYERAAPQQRFTLLLSCVRECEDCGYFCRHMQRVVWDTLRMALAWPIKAPLPSTRDARAPLTGAWLRCDVAPCPLFELPHANNGCGALLRVFLPEAAGWDWRTVGELFRTCSACSLHVCWVRARTPRACHHVRA
jgi:hypothetical protein